MTTTPGIKRRQLLLGVGTTLGALSLRGFEVRADAAAHFTHGVASGDPLADRVILWSRVLPGDGSEKVLQGRWQVASDSNFTGIVAEGSAVADPSRDYTVKVDAAGLTPGSTYWYRFLFDGVFSPVGRTKTLPVGEVANFRVGVCSCSNYPQGYFNAYRDMARSDIDVVMHLGDYIYEYPAGGYANPYAVEQLGRGVVPEHELVALEDYRQRYGLYRTDPDLQAAHAAHPWMCIWDDHELANNTWRNGAQNHNPGEGDFATRMAMARKAYHEWLPIRTAAMSDQMPIYRSFKVGQLADLILLDTRLHGRDEQLDYRTDLAAKEMSPEAFKQTVLNDPQRTMLGADQSDWLGGQLMASKARGATWQLIGQQVLMGKLMIPKLTQTQLESVELPEYSRPWIMSMQKLADDDLPMNLDAWDGYPACRERVFTNLLSHATNPVVLAGDTHNAWAFNLRNQADQAVGVELGCPGISSPGMESYLPLPADTMRAALLDSSPELVDVNTALRGWTLVTLTPEAVTGQHRFVSSVLSKDFSVSESAVLRCEAGSRHFS